MKFRTRVEHVEAVQLSIINGDTMSEPPSVRWGDTVVPDWLRDICRAEPVRIGTTYKTGGGEHVFAKVGGLTLCDGDWLVRDENGALGVCRKDVFANNYEADIPADADRYSSRFQALREMDDGSYGLSAAITREQAIERAKRDVEQWGAKASTVVDPVVRFERRHTSIEVDPSERFASQIGGSIAPASPDRTKV